MQGDAGSDTFWLQKDVLVADAGAEDHIMYLGKNITGGVRWGASELPWAVGKNHIKYGVNTDGELVIRDPFDCDTYVANYNNSLTGPYTAGINQALNC